MGSSAGVVSPANRVCVSAMFSAARNGGEDWGG